MPVWPREPKGRSVSNLERKPIRWQVRLRAFAYPRAVNSRQNAKGVMLRRDVARSKVQGVRTLTWRLHGENQREREEWIDLQTERRTHEYIKQCILDNSELKPINDFLKEMKELEKRLPNCKIYY